MPGADELVLNLSLRFGDTVMMASDNSAEMYHQPQGFRVQIEAPSQEEFDRVFEALAGDALEMAMPPGETFWAKRLAMFTERFGTPWMMNFAG